jgi:hypothetical protein
MRRTLRRFISLPNGRRLLLAEAAAWLAFARVALLAVPFRTLAARFGHASAANEGPSQPDSLTAIKAELAREIGWAITRAARHVPFGASCLPQAIAARAMLNRRRVASVMHFGVAKTADTRLAAHAWLDAGNIEVTGFPVASEFTEIARFS